MQIKESHLWIKTVRKTVVEETRSRIKINRFQTYQR